MKRLPVAMVWFRNDLRLEDHPALSAAASSGLPVLCVFMDRESAGPWDRGGASKVVLVSALLNLDRSLGAKGARLAVLGARSAEEFAEFCARENVAQVHWNRRYDPYGLAIDREIEAKLVLDGVEVHTYRGEVLLEPTQVHQANGNPYKVYTPFSNLYMRDLELEPLTLVPDVINGSQPLGAGESVADHLGEWLPGVPWDVEIRKLWEMSETCAHERLQKFLAAPIERYRQGRDVPADEGTSKLSPYLALGVISPRQIFWHLTKMEDAVFSKRPDVLQYQREIVWREFSIHLLFHFPSTDLEPLRENFALFPWEDNEIHLEAWRRGQTGYPIVDAAMRELWHTGWMHNRARMIVASFLVKHLRIHWLEGAKWFWDTLVDAHLANNSMGWQWSAGCGADAAPYFRIFNPTLQGERFDPRGEYVKRWVPELAKVDPKWIHQPWESPAGPPAGYPLPIVDHKTERERALSAFKKISVKV